MISPGHLYNPIRKLLILSVLLLSSTAGYSQAYNLDSLIQVADKMPLDTLKAKNCIEVAKQAQIKGDFDIGITYAQKAIEIGKQLNSHKWESSGLNMMGNLQMNKGNYAHAVECHKQALAIRQKMNNTKGIAASYGNIGLIYYYQGQFNEALFYQKKCLETMLMLKDTFMIAKCYGVLGLTYDAMENLPLALESQLKSMQLLEKLKDKHELGSNLGNIGNIYKKMGKYEIALKYLQKAYVIAKNIGDKYGEATTLGIMGTLYQHKEDHQHAITHFEECLKLMTEIGNKQGEASSLGNLGLSYLDLKQYDKAIKYFNESIKIKEEIGDKQGIANSWNGLSEIYQLQKNQSTALDYANKALALAKELQLTENLKNAHHNRYKIFKNTGKYKEALTEHEQYQALQDTLDNEVKRKELARKEIQFEYDKKAVADSLKNAEQQKLKDEQIKVHEITIKQEKLQKYMLYGGLAMVLLFAGFLYNRFQLIRKQKNLIEEQKQVVENQKIVVEHKNKEITDSITYARRIQQALLPAQVEISQLLPQHFILFKPKDIVSGDFYWFAKKNNTIYYATADCTGHGVPGGFMSMLGSSFLNEIILEKNIAQPAEVLNMMRDKIIEALKQNDGDSRDGMDISLCALQPDGDTTLLTYAAANNGLYIVNKEGVITFYKADKQPIGYMGEGHKPFEQHRIQLQKGDTIYTFTDGYADQFGGEKGKKMMYRRLEELLRQIHTLNPAEQKQKLESNFENWKGNFEQVDDVCLIGVRC